MHKIIVITGPTAVGKTKLSIELAKKYDGEIINADAVQVYKGLDIGSAKVTEEEKEGIIHHCVDILNPDETYSVHDFQQTVRKKITEITQRGHVPIIVGGTGLYIKAALYDYQFDEMENDHHAINEKYKENVLYFNWNIFNSLGNNRCFIANNSRNSFFYYGIYVFC